MLESIRRLFNEFDNNGILYCHWKSNASLKEAQNGDTDLDVLFLHEQRRLIEKVLTECDLKLFNSVNGQKYNGILDYIGFDYKTAQIWHLHLHYRLTIGEEYVKNLTVNWEKKLIDRRCFDNPNQNWITSPSDELFLLFTRISLKLRFVDWFKPLSQHDISEVEYLLPKVTDDSFKETLSLYLGEDSIPVYMPLLTSYGEKKNFFLIRSCLKHCLLSYSRYGFFYSKYLSVYRECKLYFHAAKNRIIGSVAIPHKRIIPIGGIVIAIVGGDGSGKSTTVKYVTKEFRKKLDVFSVYLGSGKGSSSISRRLVEIVGRFVYRKYKNAGGSADKEVYKERKDYRDLSIKEKLIVLAKALWVSELAKEKKHKLKQITKARNSGMLVICDRYPQIETYGRCDGPMLTDYRSLNSYIGRCARKEYAIYSSAYINPPDVIIRLNVPTDLALSRRPEMSKEEMLLKQAAVQAIKVPAKYYDIDTSRPFDITISEVMEAIWENL